MSLRGLSAVMAAGTLAGSLLGGCLLGGTTSEGGNPELVVGFRMDGKPAAFKGSAHVYAQGENPRLHRPPPLDEASEKAHQTPPEIVIGGYPTNYIPIDFKAPQAIRGDALSQAAGYGISVPLFRPEVEDGYFRRYLGAFAGEDTLDPARPFNMVFLGDDGTAGIAQGIAIDSARERYRGPDGKLLDILWVDLNRPRRIEGVVDTSGLSGAPMALVLPGTPFVARVQGNRFRLENLPMAVYPVRLITAAGAVFAVKEMLDAAGPGDTGLPLTLVPGANLGSLALPAAPHPMAASPVASPAGPRKFTDSIAVTLDAPPGSAVYYTLDGTPPRSNSLPYRREIVIRASCNLNAVAYVKGVNHSVVAMNTYILVPAAPRAFPAGRTFREALAVTLSADAKSSTILYTTDGSDPHAGSAEYSGPIRVDRTTLLKAVTLVSGLESSPIMEERYIFAPDSLAVP